MGSIIANRQFKDELSELMLMRNVSISDSSLVSMDGQKYIVGAFKGQYEDGK